MLLIEAKRRAGHGAWLGWLAEHFEGDQKTAWRYMEKASDQASAPNLAALQEAAQRAEQTARPQTFVHFDARWDREETGTGQG